MSKDMLIYEARNTCYRCDQYDKGKTFEIKLPNTPTGIQEQIDKSAEFPEHEHQTKLTEKIILTNLTVEKE